MTWEPLSVADTFPYFVKYDFLVKDAKSSHQWIEAEDGNGSCIALIQQYLIEHTEIEPGEFSLAQDGFIRLRYDEDAIILKMLFSDITPFNVPYLGFRIR